MQIMQSRRGFLATVSLAGAASLVGARRSLADEPPPETTTVRILKDPSICIAPQYVAEELLRAEGFSDVRYVEEPYGDEALQAWFARGELDFTTDFSASFALSIDAGAPLRVLAGVHGGCFELFGHEGIGSITDLKGKSVGVVALGSSAHVFLSIMAAYVGLDPGRPTARSRTSTGSRVQRSTPWSCLLTERSTRSSAFRPSHRKCAPRTSATWLSIPSGY